MTTLTWLWLTTCCNALTDRFLLPTIAKFDPWWDLGGLKRLGMPYCTKCGGEVDGTDYGEGWSCGVREVRSDLAEALWAHEANRPLTYDQAKLIYHEWDEDGHWCPECGEPSKCGMRDGMGEGPWSCKGDDASSCWRCNHNSVVEARVFGIGYIERDEYYEPERHQMQS